MLTERRTAAHASVYRARPGVATYGSPLGVLQLVCDVPLLPGDPGNATSFDYPVRHAVVPGLTTEAILNDLEGHLTEAVLATAEQLAREGAAGITGNCGFMIRYQDAVSEALPQVPVFLSSLLQVTLAARAAGGPGRVGILTASAEDLTPEVLALAGPEANEAVVKGLGHCRQWRASILEESGEVDAEAIEEEVVGATVEMLEASPEIGCLVLECACLPTYASAIQAAVGCPVFDFMTLIDFFHGAGRRRPFDGML